MSPDAITNRLLIRLCWIRGGIPTRLTLRVRRRCRRGSQPEALTGVFRGIVAKDRAGASGLVYELSNGELRIGGSDVSGTGAFFDGLIGHGPEPACDYVWL